MPIRGADLHSVFLLANEVRLISGKSPTSMSVSQIPECSPDDVTDVKDAPILTEESGSLPPLAESTKAVTDGSPETQSLETDLKRLRRELDLEPRRIVLAKVKGYRAWPGMVLDEALLPENIQALKPKTLKLAKKLKKPVIIIPVRFFYDDTYIWMKSCDVSPLNSEAIEIYLAKKTNAKKDTLTDAYKLAKDPPDMLDFITWGSTGRPPTPEPGAEDAEATDSDISGEPQRKKLKLKFKIKRKQVAKKASNTTVHANMVKDSSNEPNEDFEEDAEGFDSDWGLDEGKFDFQSGDYIFDDEEEQKAYFSKFPTASELAANLSVYQSRFAGLHFLVSPQLMLEEEGDEKKVMAELRKVEKLVGLADTPLIAFRKSPLYRVLLLTVHKPAEVSKSETVRMYIGKIFGKISLQPCVITTDDLWSKPDSLDADKSEEAGTEDGMSKEKDFDTKSNASEHGLNGHDLNGHGLSGNGSSGRGSSGHESSEVKISAEHGASAEQSGIGGDPNGVCGESHVESLPIQREQSTLSGHSENEESAGVAA